MERFSIACGKKSRVYFGFVLQNSAIGWQSSRHFLNQAKPKPIVTFSHALSRPWRRLHVFASNSDWLIVLFTSTVILVRDLVTVIILVLRHSIEVST